MSFSIAIDGPAGAGKSTIAKKIAEDLGFIYIDTGAMYRAMGLFMNRLGITENQEEISEKCKSVDIQIAYKEGVQQVILGEENVTGLIRTQEIGHMASVVASNLDVREKLVELQRKMAQQSDVVMDGRDIGTNVLPDSQLKIFLTAKASARAKRRHDELTLKGIESDVLEIQQEIEERDRRDENREHAPLKQAEDAVYIDTSDMTIEEVVEAVRNQYNTIISKGV